jgi:hypothetical protein
LKPSEDAVKKAKLEGKYGGGRARYSLRGWELGAVTVGVALASTLLAVPRAARPLLFPVPLVDPAEAAATRQKFADLAAGAERTGLPFETRAVGDAVRRFGAQLAAGVGDGEFTRRLMSERVTAALAAGQFDALVRLRAVQARLFVQSVRAYDFTSPVPVELAELGGDFATRAKANGWVGPGGCVATDDELVTLFVLRWSDLTRLQSEARFKPTLAELRRYYRFLLVHPERGDGSARAKAAARLRYAEALAKRDGDYPIDLVRGALLGELGDGPASARSLTEHLRRSSGAEWQLRARDYLLFVATELGEADGAIEPTDEP